jgi:hypothetical protein
MKHFSQYDAIGVLLKRKRGATAAELIAATMSTAVHKRMSEMRAKGWTIRREQIEGKSYGRYRGEAPKSA